jgi:hypothetical protein
MRTLGVFWLVLIVSGVVAMVCRSMTQPLAATPCEYVAKRYLPVSFRLQDGDWSVPESDAPSLSGKYTDRPYEKGKAICGGSMLTSPQILPGDTNAVVLNVAAGPLNAGAVVDIWRNKKVVVRGAQVLTVLCSAKDCPYVVVGVRDQDVAAVTEGDAVPVLLIRQLP